FRSHVYNSFAAAAATAPAALFAATASKTLNVKGSTALRPAAEVGTTSMAAAEARADSRDVTLSRSLSASSSVVLISTRTSLVSSVSMVSWQGNLAGA